MALIIREGTLPAIASISMCGLAIGHILGGPDEDDRTLLAFATVSRHPGVAIAIAALTGEPLAPIGVLLAVAVNEVAVRPYMWWRQRLRRRNAAASAPAGVHRGVERR
jgi:BASS family bile acid:Na+ symporter